MVVIVSRRGSRRVVIAAAAAAVALSISGPNGLQDVGAPRSAWKQVTAALASARAAHAISTLGTPVGLGSCLAEGQGIQSSVYSYSTVPQAKAPSDPKKQETFLQITIQRSYESSRPHTLWGSCGSLQK